METRAPWNLRPVPAPDTPNAPPLDNSANFPPSLSRLTRLQSSRKCELTISAPGVGFGCRDDAPDGSGAGSAAEDETMSGYTPDDDDRCESAMARLHDDAPSADLYRDPVVGDRVAPSDYSLRWLLDERSKWMKWSSQWASADAAYQRDAARRGTVTGATAAVRMKTSGSLTVTWDDGRVSHCLPYMVRIAREVRS